MTIKIGPHSVGNNAPLLLIAGPCVIENEALCEDVATALEAVCTARGINFVFKASFDKANRTSIHSPRGPGLSGGLGVLAAIKRRHEVPVLTDVHEAAQCEQAAAICDVLQIPAFLSRQTDLLFAAGRAAATNGRAVNIKKGQFMAPEDMEHAVAKVKEGGCVNLLLTERGTTFGYNNLIVDFRSLEIMRRFAPVCFDATHSVQRPSAGGTKSGGDRGYVPLLTRAAVAVGIDALFIETHPDPDNAHSDGPNMIPLHLMAALLDQVLAVRQAVAGTSSVK